MTRPRGRQPMTSVNAKAAYEFIREHPDGVTYRELAQHLGWSNANRVHILLCSLIYYPVWMQDNRLFPFVDGDEEQPDLDRERFGG